MKIKVADEAGYSIVLRRKRTTHNEDRFYSMTITADLFGGVVLMRHWGRVGTAGKQRCDLHQDSTSAMGALTQLTRKKRKRHYVVEAGTTRSVQAAISRLGGPVINAALTNGTEKQFTRLSVSR